MSSIYLSNSNSTIQSSKTLNLWQPSSIPLNGSVVTVNSYLVFSKIRRNNNSRLHWRNSGSLHRLTVFAMKEGSGKSSMEKEEERVPNWAKPDSEEAPPWAKNEGQQQQSSSGFEIPFFVYLLASALTAIAAVGSVFEYLNKNPVFGVLDSDSVFYTPLLGFFAFTGIPTSAFLWFKSVETANKEAEDQDRRDGYL